MAENETNLGYMRAKMETLESEVQEMRQDHKAMASDLKEMKDQITRYKGFIGGVIFLWSCIWAAVVAGWEVWTKFGK